MPATHFICPDGEKTQISTCMKMNGCRMEFRCSTMPYLVSTIDRPWRGITPSCAGNGIRYLYLKETTDYATNPQDKVWAVLGTGLHDKLSIHKYTHNVFSEERLSDNDITGIADVLEMDENNEGKYILTDYKTWGSYRVANALGITQEEIPVLVDGKPVLLKSGKNKGKVKTEKRAVFDASVVDLYKEEFQLNSYRMLFEKQGFTVSRLRLQVIPRDGNTFIAKSRGIDKNIYLIPVKLVPDDDVKAFYNAMRFDFELAMQTGFFRRCNDWESWEGRRCCEQYCEVIKACMDMDEKHNKGG